MYATLGFSLRYTLNTVHSRFVFQNPINPFTCYIKHNLFVSSVGTFTVITYRNFPSFPFAVFNIHTIQISCKNSRFITTCTSTYFNNGILVVLRIGRNKKKFNLLFQNRNTGCTDFQFFFSDFLHFRILFIFKYLFGFFNPILHLYIFRTGSHNLFKIVILFI